MDKNELAGLEQDKVDSGMISKGITQDCQTWDMIRNQEEEWYVESIQTYGGRPVVDESKVMWTYDIGYLYY